MEEHGLSVRAGRYRHYKGKDDKVIDIARHVRLRKSLSSIDKSTAIMPFGRPIQVLTNL